MDRNTPTGYEQQDDMQMPEAAEVVDTSAVASIQQDTRHQVHASFARNQEAEKRRIAEWQASRGIAA